MAERIGMIGLGLMGLPMARHLLAAGYPLTVYNRSQGAVTLLAQEGAQPAASPREVAEHADIVITMLPDTPDVERVVLGADGVIEGVREGMLVIDMSTISPAGARHVDEQLAARGAHLLDAPVSGGDVGAQQATLSIMVGGRHEDFEQAHPLFAVLGKTITYCGPSGAGQVVKACNQVVVAFTLAATSEALVLGARAGVDPEIVLRVLGGGLAQNRVMDLRGPTMARHHFAPGGKARFHRKDLGIALDLARETGAVLPIAALIDQLFGALVANDGGDLDHSALLTVIEMLSNFSVADQAHQTH